MVSKLSLLLVGYLLSSLSLAYGRQLHLNPNASSSSSSSIFTAGLSSTGCTSPFHGKVNKPPPFVLNVKHRSSGKEIKPADHVADSKARDMTRLTNLNIRRGGESTVTVSGIEKGEEAPELMMMATLESGVSVGSGEYLMDVFMGTPPKHFSLILDTGSDLNWIQCVPCLDCFEQTGPYYDPKESTSFRHISCKDPRCPLVSSPDQHRLCESESQTCPYYYWYGDSSNTTGDFALETFTVNLTTTHGGEAETQSRRVENVMFGCGHWNRGLFHGAAGLLGLGRGPLSFSSQLRSLFGQSFSYCLVDRNSNISLSSKLIFGQEMHSYPELNFTTLLSGKQNNSADTFYYVQIKSLVVGGETLNIPEETWDSRSGGTIIDSGTTLSYFADPAYSIIREAFRSKLNKLYPVVADFPILESCYNISGVDKLELPSFGIRFVDGAEWNFPAENYFIKLDPDEVICLAILGTPRSALSIIGNYQQQNFHIMYDTNKSRLGFAPTNCAEL